MTKWLDYCVTYSSANLEMSQTPLCVHVVICDSNSYFLKLQSVLLDSGSWLALMVSPRNLGFDHCVLLWISLHPSCREISLFSFFLF